MAKPVAMAIAAHPDDIELMMAGTLALLGEAGVELHMLNIANGSCGSMTEDAGTLIRRRTAEARESAALLNAEFHEPLTNDLEIFYNEALLRRLSAIVRRVAPTILLLQSPDDYMEDHTCSSRLAVSAAFSRGMPNFVTDPPVPPVVGDVAVYHALPWGLRPPLGEPVHPSHYVDISTTLAQKRAALACHASQKEWLDRSQGLDSYLTTMEDMSRTVGTMSGHFQVAEGWRQRMSLGFCSPGADPLVEVLGDKVVHLKRKDTTSCQ